MRSCAYAASARGSAERRPAAFARGSVPAVLAARRLAGRAYGQPWSGWFFVAAAVVLGVLLVVATRRSSLPVVAKPVGVSAEDLACRVVVELLSDHLDGALSPALSARVREHLAGCAGCSRYLRQLQEVVATVGHLAQADLAHLVEPTPPDEPG